MRRKDRELKHMDDIFSVVEACSVVHVAMVDDGMPYVVALNFGFDRKDDTLILYLHSALEGRKIDILKKNPMVYFQMDCVNELLPGSPENPCSYGWKFDSVMGSDRVSFLTEESQKTHALNRIIQHFDNTGESFLFPSKMLEKTCVWQIVSKDITGKHHE